MIRHGESIDHPFRAIAVTVVRDHVESNDQQGRHVKNASHPPTFGGGGGGG